MNETLDGWLEIAKGMGLEVISQSSLDPSCFWVPDGPSRQRMIDLRERLDRRAGEGKGYAAIHEENTFANGKSRYVTHGQKESGELSCIEDYADETGAREWPRYVTVRDSSGKIIREGPAPFRSKEERLSYERLTGLHHYDRGQGDADRRARIGMEERMRK